MTYYLYALKNRKFDEIKVGITNNLKKRLVNHNCAVPNDFIILRKFNYPDKQTALKAEKAIRKIFSEDRIPKKEFYNVPDEKFTAILDLSLIHGVDVTPRDDKVEIGKDKNKLPSNPNKKDNVKRKPNNTFKTLNIPVGATLTNRHDDKTIAIVYDDINKVEFGGQIVSITKAAKILLERRGKSTKVNGFTEWMYKNELLNKKRKN